MTPMDAAMDYVLDHLWRLLGPYLVAMAPYSAVVLLAIDVVTSQHRAAVGGVCALLVVATLWRWIWIGVVQRRIQQDVRGDEPLGLLRRLGPLIVVRIVVHATMVWGSVLVLPAFFGLFLSGFVTPMLLERQRHTWVQVRNTLSWILTASSRLTRVSLAFVVIALLLAVSVFVVQALLVHTVLPSLLGFNSADLALTLGSLPWVLCVCYFLFVVLDFYWCVLSVILFYTLQTRRLGTDLRAQLRSLKGPDA